MEGNVQLNFRSVIFCHHPLGRLLELGLSEQTEKLWRQNLLSDLFIVDLSNQQLFRGRSWS